MLRHHLNKITTQRQEGQGLVEYALILVLVSVVVIVILSQVGGSVGDVFTNISNVLGGNVVVSNGGNNNPPPNNPPADRCLNFGGANYVLFPEGVDMLNRPPRYSDSNCTNQNGNTTYRLFDPSLIDLNGAQIICTAHGGGNASPSGQVYGCAGS